MLRRRISLTLPAAAALVAVPLLTGCGNEARPGAAAVVGDERITVAQVQARAELVREAQEAAPHGEHLVRQSGWLNRAALDSLVRYRVIERVADQVGVDVTRREVQEYRREAEHEARGAERLRQLLLQQRSLAPEQIDQDLRMQLLVEKIADRSGADLRTPQGQQKVRALLQKASKELRVRVNPRFGTWDHAKVGLGDHKDPWLRDDPEGQGQRLAA